MTEEQKTRSLEDWTALRIALEDMKVEKKAIEDDKKREARRLKREALESQKAAALVAEEERPRGISYRNQRGARDDEDLEMSDRVYA